MSKSDKTYEKVMSGTANANVSFGDLCNLMIKLGFTERVKASHYIYIKQGVPDIVNLQAARDGKAKPYQVRQVRDLIHANKLKLS